MGGAESADEYSARHFGGPTLAAFDPSAPAHRAAALALRERLVAIGFAPARAAGLFGLTEVASVRANRAAYYAAFMLPHDAAGRAARFFVLHEVASDADLRGVLGEELVRFLAEMAAIVAVEGGWRAIVSATWFAERLIFTDARVLNVVWPGEPFPDYVMPPGPDSVGLLRVAPREPRRSALDLCCGAGAQALAAAAYSERVVGVDLNPRALRFARFNAAVNGVDRATFVAGDCYETLGDARVDAILANPPFVPWPADGSALLFRGGGPLGDDVLAKIFAGAVDHLEPRGSLAVVADFAEPAGLPGRIRQWQGEPRRTLIVLQQAYELLAYAEVHAGHLRDSERETLLVRLLRHFKEWEIESIEFGYVIQTGEPGTTHVVRTAAPQTGSIATDVAAWISHQRRLAGGDFADVALELAPGLGLTRTFARRSDGGSAAAAYAVPGPASMLALTTLSDPALAVLDRVARGNVCARDIVDEHECRELARLLDEALIRFS